ncbi:RES domain-containing protein [Tenacibaculum maritimum]|uniref:RES family NAD+ phosphorylase n=1 Tax=Tenacibaculum maritimum TaxID=107401 RepID=UPI0012E660FD|nr:RES family NAD+ phosphorylase [Tenacibaculum maritimum]CAA0229264.1 RES domain-containing protein [Tenacibaculum maritimum]
MVICSSCFNDIEIKKFIEASSKETDDCSYCKQDNALVISLDELSDFFLEFLGIFVIDEELGAPVISVINEDWGLFSEKTDSKTLLNDILEGSSNLEIKSSDALVVYLEEIQESTSYWDNLKDNLKWKRRFLTDVDEIINLGWDTFFNIETELEKDKVLHRARIHSVENDSVYPPDKMGSPPREYSTNGRANPEGIPYLYLSENIQTTFYETRVTYLDELSVGDFKLKKEEKVFLVDFTNYSSPFLSMDDIIGNAKSRLLQRKISFDLSKPIRRYDSQLEYLPTQFICEFIRYVTGADGIVFDSSLHKGGVNYVIFSKEKFECIEVKKYHINSVNIEGVLE